MSSASPTRRGLLRACGLFGIAAVSGCLGSTEDDETPPEPVDLYGQSCDMCGMLIGEHFGPNAQIFYRGGEPPEKREGPAWFDSTNEAFSFHEHAVQRGHEKTAMFVVDYATVDWDVSEHDGTVHLSTHASAGDFVDVRETTLVVDSEVVGAMGPDAIPFSAPASADAFIDAYGGTRREPSAFLDID